MSAEIKSTAPLRTLSSSCSRAASVMDLLLLNGIEVKKGDRLFFNSDDEITAEGDLKAVICC